MFWKQTTKGSSAKNPQERKGDSLKNAKNGEAQELIIV